MTEHGIIGLTRKCFARKTSSIREIRAIRVRQFAAQAVPKDSVVLIRKRQARGGANINVRFMLRFVSKRDAEAKQIFCTFAALIKNLQ